MVSVSSDFNVMALNTIEKILPDLFYCFSKNIDDGYISVGLGSVLYDYGNLESLIFYDEHIVHPLDCSSSYSAANRANSAARSALRFSSGLGCFSVSDSESDSVSLPEEYESLSSSWTWPEVVEIAANRRGSTVNFCAATGAFVRK